MKRFLCLILAAVMITLSGCTAQKTQSGTAEKYQTYRDIPGVTRQEIDEIETLKAERGVFSYGHLPTTESFRQPDGTYAGFVIEVCKLLSDLFDTQFEPVVYSEWGALKDDIDNKTVNFSSEFTSTAERMQLYGMTKPIAGRGLNIYYLTGTREIITESDINGMKIGFLGGAVTSELVTELYPGVRFEKVDIPGITEALDLLLSGGIDAFVSDSVVDIMFEDYKNIRSREIFKFVYAPVSITTNDPELLPFIHVIDKYLDSGGMTAMFELYREGSYAYKKYKLNQSFTEEELKYLADLKQRNAMVNVALQHDAYPASFYNTVEKRYDGAAYDILSEVTELTGIVFNSDCMPVEKALSDILAKLKTDEVSMIPQLLYSDSRKNDYIWSGISYITTNYALLSKSDYPDLKPFQVYYSTVGTVNKSAHEEVFKELFPGHEKTKVYNTGDEGFDALERGEIDLLMLAETMLLVQTNYREKLGYKVNITFDKTLDTLFGYNKDEVILRNIIDKAMSYIDVKGIEESWLSRVFDYQSKVIREMTPLIMLSVAALFAALLIVLMFYIKNRRINKNLERIVANRTSELEYANRAKSDFLSRMSHEIRTPLTAIIGMIGIAENTEDQNKIIHCLKRADSASTHLLGIINDILDMSKIEANKFELDHRRFSFEKMLMNISNVMNFWVDEKRQQFIVNLDTNVPEYVIGDDLRLSQVITNLLTNAVKFTPENGMIRLNIEKIDDTDEELTLKIEVEDNGIGISDEQKSRLFNSFEQADGGTARKFGGTGLGLSISKRIVELMGGNIWIESEPGIGSKFIFTVKVQSGTEKTLSEPVAGETDEAPRIFDFSGHTILIAEDVEVNREIMSALLESTGIKIDFAVNGQSAVSRFRENPGKYSLIFMDVHMPEMDGYEATRTIRAMASAKAKQIPILALTANAFREDVENCLAAGMNDHIGKPINVDILLEKLRDNLDGFMD